MANYYLDYVGLNTFIYEPIVYDFEDWTGPLYSALLGKEVFTQVEGFFLNGEWGELAKNAFGHSDHFYPDVNFFGWSKFFNLGTYKNHKFPVQLVDPQTGAPGADAAGLLRATASFFPALMLHRNGPYGFPTWKQIRVGDNPLTRKQRKENIFTFVREPGEEFTFREGGKVTTLKNKYGRIEAYSECPVTSKYKPVSLFVRPTSGKNFINKAGAFEDGVGIKSVLGNATQGFVNDELNRYYGIELQSSQEFEDLADNYLKGSLQSEESPFEAFKRLIYTETVFPQKLYTYKKFKRQRTTFSFPWRDSREDRKSKGKVDNGFSTPVNQSIWPLDVQSDWLTRSENLPRGRFGTSAVLPGYKLGFGISGIGADNDSGILFNTYSSFHTVLPLFLGFSDLDAILRVAPIYSRRQMLINKQSFVSPSGMRIEGVNWTGETGTTNFPHLQEDHAPTGEAFWDAPSQSNNAPFYDSYDKYYESLKGRYKDYTILPEFRISNHVQRYQTLGATEENLDLFELTGGLANTTGSAQNNFYKIFTNTDFLEHFEIIQEKHDKFVDPSSILLKCKAVKKFLPYDGFYPVQRTVDLAKQFVSSYTGSFAIMSNNKVSSDKISFAVQNVMTPLFAPGVLYNAIKAGVAVDFPIFTGSANITATTQNADYPLHRAISGAMGDPTVHTSADNLGGTRIELTTIRSFSGEPTRMEYFNTRIPFRALFEPERFLAGYNIPCMEPHPSGNISASCLYDGQGDQIYKLMMHNFLSEVPDFFLQDESFSFLASKKSSDPTVGNAKKNRVYMMRVKMFKSVESGSFALANTSGSLNELVEVPQAVSGADGSGRIIENFTMYSRPLAFGPPTMLDTGLDYYGDTIGMDSLDGLNMPYTPPYYDGQAWADISFRPTETKKYSINEIILNSDVKYYRYIHPSASHVSNNEPIDLINMNCLQLSASLNLFGKASVKQSKQGANTFVNTLEQDDQQWVIAPRFETPMLNFNHLSASTSVSLPLNGSQSVPRGMWHQYGRIEDDPQKGVFMQVTDVPEGFIKRYLGGEPSKSFNNIGGGETTIEFTGSLAELCGFDSTPVKMGKLATVKKISEAIVAVPFLEEDGRRKFFDLDRNDVDLAKRIVEEGDVDAMLRAQGKPSNYEVNPGIISMIDKMTNYVFPPPMDFRNNVEIDPFAMYVFEFHHNLTKQDLSNIWQGLMPRIGTTQEEAHANIGTPLLKKALLGIDRALPKKLRWMVFKVKKRAKTNYYEKILDRSRGFGNHIQMLDNDYKEQLESFLKTDLKPTVSFNWPYDFFSLVEVAKLDASVTFKSDKELIESAPVTPPPIPFSEPPAPEEPPPPPPPELEIYKQKFFRAAQITETYYRYSGSTTNIKTVQTSGDTRIESKRVLTTLAQMTFTEIFYKYDTETKLVDGDQT